MGINITPAEMAEKWRTRISSAGAAITRGVDAVDVAPGQKAAAQDQKWYDNVVASRDKWKARVGAVTLADWRKAMKDKGIPNISSGANAAKNLFQNFASALLTHQEAGLQALESLPTQTPQNMKDRMIAWFDHMAGFSWSRWTG